MSFTKALVLAIVVLAGLGLAVQTKVTAQSCPVCSCGDAQCDSLGNCSCPSAPGCECGNASCSNGQWVCESAPTECGVGYSPACVDGGWECEAGGGGGCEFYYNLPGCYDCDPCDWTCNEYAGDSYCMTW